MKKVLLIVVVAVAAVAALFYFVPSWNPWMWGTGGATTGGRNDGSNPTPPPVSAIAPNPLPPPVSTTAGKVSAALGIINGRARLAPGSTVVFAKVKVAIYDPKTNKELESMFLGADGSYAFSVTAGEYVLNLIKGTGSSKNLPQRIYVGPGETLDLNFQVGK